ncbi:Succinate-semialdehyde dehydrogenase, partial [Dysosmobacter welbionis]
LRHRRRHPGGRGPFRQARGPQREDQGRRRYRRPEGRGGLHQPGCLPPGHQPHRQGREGHGREIRR